MLKIICSNLPRNDDICLLTILIGRSASGVNVRTSILLSLGLFASHVPTCLTRSVCVTGINMVTRCSHRVRTYSMDQLKARSICSPQKIVRLGHITHAYVMVKNVLYWKKDFRFILYKNPFNKCVFDINIKI